MGMKCHKEIKKRRLRSVLCLGYLFICMLLLLTGCRKETAYDEHEETEESEISITDIQDEETAKQYDGDYEYEILEDDTVIILSYHGSEEQVFIPEKLEGKVVSAIGEKAFYSNGNVREVLIPSGIVSIGESAFAYCSRLEYIIMGQGVREIYSYAFAYCPSLEKVYLPQSMENMGLNAFTGCTNLQLIYGSTPYAERYAIQEGKTYVDLNRIEI